METGIHHGDIFLAQSYIHEGSYRPSLSDYLMHAIPRQRSRVESWPPIHHGGIIPCSHVSCGTPEAAITSISTEWPLILRIDPILRVPELAFLPDIRDVSCPLTLNLGSNVEYTQIAQVIYLPPDRVGGVGHYVAKIRVGDSTYLYNDCRHGGLLSELGALHLLEDYEPKTSFVIYLRTSKSSARIYSLQKESSLICIL